MPVVNVVRAQRVLFLTGSVELYGEETLAQVAAQSRALVGQLSASDLPVAVEWRPVLTSPDAIRRAFVDAEGDDGVIGVITWMHTFSPAKMWIAGLDVARKPLLHLHTQANRDLPWSTIDFDFMNLNQSAHGDREFAYIQSRMGVARKTVVGHLSNPVVASKVESWQRAALGWAALQGLKMARFGDNMRHVAVTEGDKTEAELRFGVEVNTWSVNELAAAVEAADAGRVRDTLADYDASYLIAEDLRAGGSRRASVEYAARLEVGLRTFLEEGGFGAFTTTFEDLGALRQLPGVAVQRLMADGYGFGPEGDWKTSILLTALNAMGAGRTGGSSLMEDYTYHLEPGNEMILGAHMLEVSPAISSQKPSLEVHPLGIGGREDPARLVFDADPGEAIVVAMSDMRERFRLVANSIDVVELPEPLPNLPVARALWKPRPDFATSTEAWLTAGGAHHTVLSNAVTMDELRDFALITRTELAVVDETTTAPGFAAELRYNKAYYRLAAGL